MTPERWSRIKELFQAALDQPTGARAGFLDRACAGDDDTRREVDSLLGAHGDAGGFLETPALADASGDGPALRAGVRLGPYEIGAAIGSGGMGEVYRARDGRLGRDVAIKVLPAAVANDAARGRRLEQEARAASALNHPNIVAVYDIGQHGGAPYLVTELLEGESLAERIARAPVPLRKAVEWAAQAASGLVAAHERGIVHRDLKPANLFLTSQGQVKILDFGVAKLAAEADQRPADAGSNGRPRTAASLATGPGLVLGTVGYMAPEQIRAGEVDFRADQFALGCVLHQLLTGSPPFARESASATIAAVLDDDPPALTGASPRVARAVAWIVERCLAKDRDDRYASTRDLARDLELALGRLADEGPQARPRAPDDDEQPGRQGAGHLAEPTGTIAPPPARARAHWRAAAWGASLAVAIAATWLVARPSPAPAASVPSLRYLTYSGLDTSPAASPDGALIAFSSRRDGHRRIWLEQVATGSEAPLTRGEDDHPRFSRDGSVVLFARAEGRGSSLYRVPVVGGEPRKLVDDALYGDYSPDGRRLAFVRQIPASTGASPTIQVFVAAADGSAARRIAALDGSRFPAGAFVAPRWSPDGRWLAATQSTLQLGEPTLIAVIDAESGRPRALTQPSAAGVWRGALAWSGPDRIVYAEPESVVGQQTGASSRVVEWDLASGRTRPLVSTPVNLIRLDVLGRGRLILEARALRQNLREIALAPAGYAGDQARWLSRGNAADRQPTYAPAGDRLVFSSNRSGNLDLWSLSRATGAVERLTDDPAQDSDPGFLPDGRLVWSSNRSGRFEIWIAAADGSGAHQLTRDGVDAENPVATPDGAWIVYASAGPRTRGIMRIRPDGTGAAQVVAGNAIEPEVSPDGRHVAFVSDQGSARAALRVARLADGAPLFAIDLPPWVSGDGVDQGRSRWLPDGRGLAYVTRDTGGYAVFAQDFAPGRDTRASRRRLAWLGPELAAESFAVSPDGAFLTVAFREQVHDLLLADGVDGVDRAR